MDHYTHCPGCICGSRNLPLGDIVLVPVSANLMREMTPNGWSRPVKVKIDRDGNGLWEMTVMTDAASDWGDPAKSTGQ